MYLKLNDSSCVCAAQMTFVCRVERDQTEMLSACCSRRGLPKSKKVHVPETCFLSGRVGKQTLLKQNKENSAADS